MNIIVRKIRVLASILLLLSCFIYSSILILLHRPLYHMPLLPSEFSALG